MKSYRITAAVLALAFCPLSYGQNTSPIPEEYEQILVPLTPWMVNGANGSVWSHEFAILNSGTTPMIGYSHPMAGDVPQPDIFPALTGCYFPVCPDHLELPPGAVFLKALLDYNEVGHLGLIMSAKKQSSNNFQYQLRVMDLSRNASSAGVEIPVVRLSEFSDSTIHLLNLPADPRFRITLRVYAPRQLSRVSARIRVINQASNEVVSDAVYPLAQPSVPIPDIYPGFPVHPDFVQVSNIPLPAPPNAGVRIEISSAAVTAPIWAFASITNNDTQEVLIVTPQNVGGQPN